MNWHLFCLDAFVETHSNQPTPYFEQAGDGPPLILLGGYRADISSWSPIRNLLSKFFSVYTMENRGVRSDSTIGIPISIDLLAEDVKNLISFLGLQKPHILGHSMGGAVAQVFASKYPELTGKIILANTLISVRARPAYALQYLFSLRESGLPFITALEGSLPWLFSSAFLNSKPQVDLYLEQMLQIPHKQSIAGQKQQLSAILSFDSSSWYKSISVPTLVIEGDEDILCPYDSGYLAKGIMGAKLVTLKKQAHIPHYEIPEKFVAVVQDFLLASSYV